MLFIVEQLLCYRSLWQQNSGNFSNMLRNIHSRTISLAQPKQNFSLQQEIVTHRRRFITTRAHSQCHCEQISVVRIYSFAFIVVNTYQSLVNLWELVFYRLRFLPQLIIKNKFQNPMCSYYLLYNFMSLTLSFVLAPSIPRFGVFHRFRNQIA